MRLQAGTRLGPYEIVSPLRAGGMGEVYRARDSKLHRNVAIKVMSDRVSGDERSPERFEREARAVAALSHPNIVSIFEFGSQDGLAYAVIELLEGETLRTLLAHGPLPIRKAIDYGAQVCRGLAAAHDKGIVHRDLKPENLFVTPDGRVKILDFGLSKTIGAPTAAPDAETAAGALSITQPGTIVGTVGYMSPEQVRGERADHRSDIFSFGSVLYEMVSGRRAFRGDSTVETMHAILTEDPPDPVAAGRPALQAVVRLVRRCLEKTPGERFQSAADLAFALDSLSDAGTTPVTDRIAQSSRRRTWIAAALAVLTLVVAGTYLVRSRAWFGSPPHASFQMITFSPQTIFRALFAPDGQTIIYSAALRGNRPELFAATPQFPEPRPMGQPDTQLLSISAKGELAVLVRARYYMHRLFIGTLARMPLEGGAPREIREDVHEADWAPDGQTLAIIERVGGKDRLEYPIGKTLCETAGYLSDLRFSPAGDRIAFFEHPIGGDDRGSIAMVDLAGTKRVLMPERYASEEGLAWSADGREVLFSAGDSPGFYCIYAVSLDGTVRTVLTSAGGLLLQDVAHSGRWLAVRDDVRLSAIARGPDTSEPRDVSLLDYTEARDISRDGRTVLFSEASAPMGRNYGLYVRSAAGSAPVRLGEGMAAALSPDGKWALSLVPSPNRLVMYPTGPGEARVLPRGTIETYNAARWFPDGRRVLVCGNERAHAIRCYEQDVAGGPPRAITPEGMAGAAISPDGKQLAARDADNRVVLFPLDGGQPRSFAFLAPDDRIVRWTPDGSGLLVYTRNEMPAQLDRVDVRTGRRTAVRPIVPPDLAGSIALWDLAVADDDSYYAYSVWQQRSTLFLIGDGR